MSNAVPRPVNVKPTSVQPEQPAQAPKTPGITVLGWMLIVFAVIPLILGLGDRAVPILAVGGAMALIGVVLVLAGRVGREADRSNEAPRQR